VKGYAETVAFSREQIADYHLAAAIVAGLSEKQPDGDWVRCHELARAVACALNSRITEAEWETADRWRVVDGRFGGAEHSWLVWGGRGRTILDVYAVAELPQVKLVDCNTLWRRHNYEPGERRRDIRFAVFGQLRDAATKIAEGVRLLNDVDRIPAGEVKDPGPGELDGEGHPDRKYDPETNSFRNIE
jgi:hypothetical protein